VINDKIFVIGGDQYCTPTSSVECYDEKSNKWIASGDMEIGERIDYLSACIVMCLPNVCDYIKYITRTDQWGGGSGRVVDFGN
jgi:hypothetical protein